MNMVSPPGKRSLHRLAGTSAAPPENGEDSNAGPWDTFHLGVAGRTAVSLSLVIQLTGLAIILLNWALAIRPSPGMLLNFLSVGPILTSILEHLPIPQTLAAPRQLRPPRQP